MTERGKCYIYGSMHIKMPREDILRELLSKVDYVLLEGFNVGDWRSLIRRKPSVTLIVLGVLTYSAILDLHIRVMDKWYRLRGKPPFRGDMEYVRDYAVKLSKIVEVVDASLDEVFSEQLVNLRHSLRFCGKVAVFLITVLIVLLYACIISRLYVHAVAIVFLILYILLKCVKQLSEDINDFRDSKVVRRAKELIEMSYNVLIVRGKRHVPFLKSELQKHSIICEVYET
jgi:hypothetical protein